MMTLVDVWLSPSGEEAALNVVKGNDPTDDPDYEPWFPEFPGEREPIRYALTNSAVEDVLVFSVQPLEPWSYIEAASDLLCKWGWKYVRTLRV